MDRRANHKLWPTICVFILTAAGAVWNCGTVLGEAQPLYPANGAVIAGDNYPPTPPHMHVYTPLEFIPGATAVKHVAYFSDTYDDVANRIEDANLGEPPYPTMPNRYYVGLPMVEPYTESLVRGTTYYWTVDETDTEGNTLPGDIWEFTIRDFKAILPDPPNEATFIETDPLLCWSDSVEAQEYDVYIGTDWNDVNDAPHWDPNILPPYPLFLGTVSGTCIQVYDLAFDTKYYWRVDAVYGRYPPPIGGGVYYKGDVWCFTTVPEGLGTIRMDLWWNYYCPGCPIILLIYPPYIPHEIRFLTSFNSGLGLGENYAGNIHGWLHPAKSGDYTFWLCTDEEGELYLSSDESPSNIQLIAKESTWTNPFTWKSGGEEQSAPISLVAGRKYYIMALWTEGLGGDHCMVAWQGPDQPLAPVAGSADAVIPGSRLSPFGQYWAHDPDPCDGQAGIGLPVNLRWEPGDIAVEHNIYIGTNFNAVKNAVYDPINPSSEFLATTTVPSLLVTGLEFNTKYYWRVDEVSSSPLPPSSPYASYYKGDVWSFTTAPRRIYVDIDANGANNGTNWENAYNYLHKALSDANSSEKPVEICVAQGIYKPNQGIAGIPDVDWRLLTFQLINGVILKGGYAGFGEPNPNARDIKLYETILSGDLDGNDVEVTDPCDLLTEPTRAENSYHVIVGNETTDENTILDGFIVIGGNAHRDPRSPDYLWKRGGGMSCTGSSPTVTNCTFVANTACWGAGMFIGSGRPNVYNCTFRANAADHHAGALEVGVYSISIINCDFISNFAAWCGGAVWNFDANPPYINCVFSGNVAGDDGGAIWNVDSSGYEFINCTFTNNTAGRQAGAIDSDYWPMITNCIFWGNRDSSGMGESAHVHAYYGPAAFNYSCVQGWTGALGGIGNIDADPCFFDPCIGDYHLKSQAGRWEPSSESWVVDDVTSPCIDAGNPGCPVGDEPAPNGNRRNMGAYGGTAEASKSPANWRSIADMTNDWVVDSNDLKVFVDYWLKSGECIPSDFDRSHFVNFDDFAIFGLHWSYPSTEPGMTFNIGDCTMEAGQKWTAAAEPNQPRFSVWVEGRYIYFEDQMYANCCPDELGLDKEINGNQIILYEIGYGGMCDCMCYFPITATLGPFEDGTYTVEVYDNYGNSLGVVEVTIGQPSELTIIYEIEDCNQDASGVSAAIPPDLTRFTVSVEGQYIHFEDMMTANCCPDELGLEMTVEGNLITIRETEYTPGGCYCICDYPITATLGPFEPGTYTLEVYEEWGGFIGSTTVVIEPPQ